jgi:Arc/MetJ-type ribon-helix-helix transcriptional regulator
MYGNCMKNINISLPSKLKSQAEALVLQGHFSTFSDLVRTAIRDLLRREYMKEKEREKEYQKFRKEDHRLFEK